MEHISDNNRLPFSLVQAGMNDLKDLRVGDYDTVLVLGQHTHAYAGCDYNGLCDWLPTEGDFVWLPLANDEARWAFIGETKVDEDGHLLAKVYMKKEGA